MEEAITMKTKLGGWALTELESTEVPKEPIIEEISDMHQKYSNIDNGIDKIGNLISILGSKGNNFLG